MRRIMNTEQSMKSTMGVDVAAFVTLKSNTETNPKVKNSHVKLLIKNRLNNVLTSGFANFQHLFN